jgi:type II restriction/modification system DNA methylase subunit YeeA
MCQESLINYLATELEGKVSKEDIETLIRYGESVVEHDSRVIIIGRETERYSFKLPESIRKNAKLIDEKLSCVRVCDPAVGSGAFPVGMMTLIIRTRNALTPYISNGNKRTLYNFKRQAIQNCLYGVDIDPGAIEIAKLRLWLSLIVDEEDIKQIKPLPNLDYKIMQGDSLVSEFMGINLDKEDESQDGQLNLQKSETDVLIRELKKKKDEYLNKANAREKEELKQEIEDLVIRIFETKLQKQKSDYFKQLKSIEEKYKVIPNAGEREEIIKKEKEKLYQTTGLDLEKFEQQLREFTTGNKIRPFFPWHLYFAEVFQEKGGFDVVIANPPYVRQERIKDYKPSLQKAGYNVFNSTSDLYTYFYEKSFNILAHNKYLCFISSNKWMRAKYGENLRKFLKENTKVLNLIDFGGYPVFEATVDTNIILFKKESPNKEHQVRYVNVQSQIDGDLITYVTKHQNLMPQEKLSNNAWTLADESVLSLKEKIEKIGKPLKDWDVKIYRGILTGFNEAFIIDTETRNRILSNCETEEERKRTEQIIKPVLRGRDIGRYYYRWEGLWLIGTFPTLNLDIDDYPALKKYLKTFGDRLNQDGKPGHRKKTNNKWFETQDNIAYYPEFEKEKIVWQRVTQTPKFTLVPKGFYCEATTHFITTDKEEYYKLLLGIFNSKFFEFVFYKFYMGGGIEGEIKGEFIGRFPIPPLTLPTQPVVSQILKLLDKIFYLTQYEDYSQNPEKRARVKEYENQIDQLIYKLYGLTPEEIKIVESTN